MPDEQNRSLRGTSTGNREETGSLVTFPRERSLDRPSHNLPLERTSFVGREREVAEIERLLSERQLLTLCGPGGAGKTRLALAVAQDLVEGFEGDVWWVELASGLRPRARAKGGSLGAGRARGAGPLPDRGARGQPEGAQGASGAGQLRASGGGVRRPRRCPARDLPGSETPGDQPRALARGRRDQLHGAEPLRARSRAFALYRRVGRIRGGAALRRACQGGRFWLRADGRERPRGGAALQQAGRHTARHRARCGENAGANGRADPREAG